MRYFVFILFFLNACLVRATDTLSVEKHYRKLYFYTAGLQAFSDEYLKCGEMQAAKMGFGHKRKGGCVIGPLKYLRIQSHNRRVEKKLVRRFGADWEKKYKALLADCKS